MTEIDLHLDINTLDGFEAFGQGEESPMLKPIKRQTDVNLDFLLGRIATEISDHTDCHAENAAREIIGSARVDLSGGRIALEGLERVQEIIYRIFPNLMEAPELGSAL